MPTTSKKHVFVSSLLPKTIIEELGVLGYEAVQTKKSDKIKDEVAYHPDIRLLKLPNGAWLTDNYEQIINKASYDLKIEHKDLKKSVTGGYPQECALNCFFSRDLLFGGAVIAEELVEFVNAGLFRHIKCRQGYAKCSTAKLNDDAFITADTGIFEALIANGADALKVSNDGIKLDGYSCGFFGGCSGKLGDELLVFTGRIESHVDYNNIKSFCSNHGITPYSLSLDNLYDYGGLLEI